MTAAGINLRGRVAALFNPAGIEVGELTQQLERIGMRVMLTTADRVISLGEYDFFFAVLASEGPCKLPSWNERERPISIIILDSETPTVLERLSSLQVDAVLMRPFRSSGVLAALVHAQRQWYEKASLRGEVDRLHRKLRGFRTVEKAKEILAENRQVTGDQAFAILREHAMRERTTVESIAQKIVDATRILAQGLPDSKSGSLK